LRVRVQFSDPDLRIAPKRVWNLHATITTLPNQALVRVALFVVRFFLRIEPFLVHQYLRPAGRIKIGSAAIAIAEERGSPTFKMVLGQLSIEIRLKSLRQHRALLVD